MMKFSLFLLIVFFFTDLNAEIKINKKEKYAIFGEFSKSLPQFDGIDYLNSSNGIGLGVYTNTIDRNEFDSYIKVIYNSFDNIDKEKIGLKESDKYLYSEIKISAGLEYNLIKRSKFTPFVNLEGGYMITMLDSESENSSTNAIVDGSFIAPGIGARYVLNDNFLFRAAVNYSILGDNFDYRFLNVGINIGYVIMNREKKN